MALLGESCVKLQTLYNSRFQFRLEPAEGCGGKLVLLTSKTNKAVSYVVKDDCEQSSNEFAAQHLLKALGYTSMDTREIAVAYRLAHWAGILRERQTSGMGIRALLQIRGDM